MRRPRAPHLSRHGLWQVWVAAGFIIVAVYLALPSTAQAWVLTGLNFSAAIGVGIGVWLWKPQKSLAWRLFAGGVAIYATGNAIWYLSNLMFGVGESIVHSANFFYAGGYLTMAAALVLWLRSRLDADFLASIIDAAIVLTGTAVLWWALLIQPLFAAPGTTFAQQVVSALYPMADLVLAAVVSVGLFAVGTKTVSDRLRAGAVALMVITDGFYYWTALEGSYVVGHVLDLGWLVAFVLMAAAGLHPSMKEVPTFRRATQPMSKTRLAVFIGAALAGPISLGVITLYGRPIPVATVVVSSLSLFLLVLVRMVGLLRDGEQKVAQLNEQGRELQESEERYRSVVDTVNDIIFKCNPDGYWTFLNPAWERVTGFSVEETLGKHFIEGIHPDDRAEALAALGPLMRGKAPRAHYETRYLTMDGGPKWAECDVGLVYNSAGAIVGASGTLRDISERKTLQEQLSHQAFHDPLTGLANRALFSDRLEHALARTTRASGETSLAVLFVDLDDFKTINDSLGHEAGDQLLGAVAERIQASLRISDTAARLGGDEFAVLVEDTEGEDEAIRVAERIIQALDRPFSVHNHDVHVRPSIGVATNGGTRTSVGILLRNADLAMYTAKVSGKGGFALFEEGMHAAVVDRMQMKADLALAIEAEQLAVHFQPIVDMESGQIRGAEALMRWNHPIRGMVPPLDFIPLAEETDLINRLGDWILEAACMEAASWNSPSGRQPTVTVNLSGKQLQNGILVSHVADVLARSGLRPDRLVLEITESALMTDVDETVATLKQLKGLGVRLAVDDFGTGYSSLSYLQRFPLDILKIDRSFVEGIERGEEGGALAQAVIKLGQSLRLNTIAEGVETTDQAKRLRELGCNLAQGYLYSRPQPVATVSSMFSSGTLLLPGKLQAVPHAS